MTPQRALAERSARARLGHATAGRLGLRRNERRMHAVLAQLAREQHTVAEQARRIGAKAGPLRRD
jgi:hypothetical protein